jgi:hypothetical protein
MQYMLLIYGDPSAAPDYESPEGQAEFQQWIRYTQELGEAGALVKGDPLEPAETATTVRGAGGEIVHTDGPFAETKEVLGGYYLIDVPDLDAALAWAAKMPNISYGAVEVRPVQVVE